MTTLKIDNFVAPRHMVHMYGGDSDLLVRNVGRYLAQGLEAGEGILVIATPEHNQALMRELAASPGFAQARKNGVALFLDAAETLGRLMVNGEPDWLRFESVVGSALRDLHQRNGHTGVRAYGEMVGILWEQNRIPAAIRLEEYWNRLIEAAPFSLYCGYPIDVFSRDFSQETLDSVLCTHTHMHPVDENLGEALNRAMDEVLGNRAHGIRLLIKSTFRPAWASLPSAEATVIWLRANLEEVAEDILDRARSYYQATAA